MFREIAFGSPEYALARRLREDVLRKPLGLSHTGAEVAGEENQLHFGLFDPAGRLAACVVAAPLTATEAKIRQMAVSPSHQRQGLGQRLIREVERNLQARGFRRFVLGARASAVGFYQKLGYAIAGDEYVSVTLPHFRMSKTVGAEEG